MDIPQTLVDDLVHNIINIGNVYEIDMNASDGIHRATDMTIDENFS